MPHEVFRARFEERTRDSHVIAELNGQVLFDVSWQFADQIADAIKAQARLAEAADKRGPIIADQALINAHSIPLGLSADPRVRKEALKEAEDIRRKAGLPSIEPRSIVGVPTVRQAAPGH